MQVVLFLIVVEGKADPAEIDMMWVSDCVRMCEGGTSVSVRMCEGGTSVSVHVCEGGTSVSVHVCEGVQM